MKRIIIDAPVQEVRDSRKDRLKRNQMQTQRNSRIDLKTVDAKARKKKRFFRPRNIILLLILLGIAVGALYFYRTYSVAGKAFNLNPFPLLINQVTGKKPTLNSANGRVTVLVIGVDNRSEDLTPDLKKVGNTDTMMLISLNTNDNSVEFISIPRDLAIKFKFPDGNEYAKINAGVALGARDGYPGGGAQLLRDTFETLTGLKVNYTAVVNFKAFKEIIDTIGGIDVNVENSFCDAEYPKEGDKGVETVKFVRGIQHMDGTTALKFARSRVHATCYNFTAGDPVFEGTDFRRAYRQQQVIKAVQDKVKTSGLDISKVQSIIESVGNNMITQVGDGPMNDTNKVDLETLKAAFDIKDRVQSTTQYSFVVTPSVCGGNVLKETSTELGYTIIPASSNGFSLLKDCIQAYLKNPKVFSESASIAVYNNGVGNAKANTVTNGIKADWLDATNYGAINLKTLTGLPEGDTTDPTKGLFVIDMRKTDPGTTEYLVKKYNAKVLNKENLPKSLQNINIDVMLIVGPVQ